MLRLKSHQRNNDSISERKSDVTRDGGGAREDEGRKRHTGTHCGMHAQFFDKKGTNGHACTTSHTYTRVITVVIVAALSAE